MHVAKQYPSYNPYAVCSKSVRRKGSITCDDKLSFEDFKTEELKGYARLKKIPGSQSLSRDELIKTLYRYVAAMKGKEVWSVYLKKFKQSHPKLSYSDVKKEASKAYQSEKMRLFKAQK